MRDSHVPFVSTRRLAFQKGLFQHERPSFPFLPDHIKDAVLGLEASKQLFTDSGHSPEEVFKAAKEGKPLAFQLPLTAKIQQQAKLEDVNVNMDEDQMLWPLQDIIPFGAEHSTLDGVVKRAAERLNISLSPDPMPEQVIFIRSDQYSFVKQGIPAVYPSPGIKSSDPKINPLDFFGDHYSKKM